MFAILGDPGVDSTFPLQFFSCPLQLCPSPHYQPIGLPGWMFACLVYLPLVQSWPLRSVTGITVRSSVTQLTVRRELSDRPEEPGLDCMSQNYQGRQILGGTI